MQFQAHAFLVSDFLVWMAADSKVPEPKRRAKGEVKVKVNDIEELDPYFVELVIV